MRSADGQKIVNSPLSRPLRAKSEAGSVGGRFIAHGIAPSTFAPIPKPRKVRVGPSESQIENQIRRTIANGGRLYSRHRKTDPASGLKKLEAHNAQMQIDKPTGFVAGKKCSWCQQPFAEQRAYSYHRAICESRTGGPLPTGPLGLSGGKSSAVECACKDCGEVFNSGSERRRHIRNRSCPMDERPSMCRKCGKWFSSFLDSLHCQDFCCTEGAD